MRGGYGLTLVEVLVAMGVASIVGALLLVIMVNSAGLFYKESSKVEQGLSLNDALLNIKQALRGASNVASTYPPTGSPTYTSSATQLVLKVPSIDSSGNIVSGVFDYFIFFQDGGKLRFKTFPDDGQSARKGQDQIFTTNLDSLIFEYFDGQIPPQQVQPNLAVKIKITLSLKQKAGAGIETNVATAEANLRND